MPSESYMHGQVTEVGADPANMNGGGHMNGGGWETNPGSATAYQGTDFDNSAPEFWGTGDALSDAEQLVSGDMNGITQGLSGPLEEWQEELMGNVTPITDANGAVTEEPCPVTMAEWQAHKAQMSADAAHAKKQKMIHLAAAAVAGYVLCKFMT